MRQNRSAWCVWWALGVGLAGVVLLATVYLSLDTWAQGLPHAPQFLWEDRFIVTPILLGFGVQAALKKGLCLPLSSAGPSGPLLGASGATSTAAMATCCAHHVTDVLPLLGLTAAATLSPVRCRFQMTVCWRGRPG